MDKNVNPKAIIWAVFSLLGLTIAWVVVQSLQTLNSAGELRVTLPIRAYPLTHQYQGNYLLYEINYGSSINCPSPRPAIMCLNLDLGRWIGTLLPAGMQPKPAECPRFIRGQCKGHEFRAKIEYLRSSPEQLPTLKQGLAQHQGKVVLRIDTNGLARIVDLYIGEQPWQHYLQSH